MIQANAVASVIVGGAWKILGCSEMGRHRGRGWKALFQLFA